MLSLKQFHRAPDKVRQVEFHPVLPWVVSVTKSDYVAVWDYSKQQLVLEMQLGGEEEFFGDTDLARLHLKDAAVTLNPSVPANSISRSPTGTVRAVRFLDADVVSAQLTANHLLASGTGSPQPTSAPITGLRGQRLLVVVADARVLLVDLVSRAVRDVPKTALEGRAPTCCSFLLMGGQEGGDRDSHVLASPVLALGCSDGVVRLVSTYTLRPVARCVSPHKSAVVTLTVAGVTGMPHEALVAGFAGGSVCAWEPFSRKLPAGGAASGMALQDVSPKADADRCHDKDVVGVVVAAFAEDAESSPSRLILTTGVDSRLYGLDPSTLKESVRVKLDPKSPPTSLAYAPRGFVASGAHCVLVGTEVGMILAVHPPTGSIKLAANLALLVPSGTKKAPKVYCLAVHPTQPQLVAAACNSGVALLKLDALPPLPVAPLPLRVPAQALPVGAGGGGSGVTFLVAMGSNVQCVSASVVDVAALEAAAAASPEPPAAAAAAAPANAPNFGRITLLDLLDLPAPSARTEPSASAHSAAPAAARRRPTIIQVLGCMRVAEGKPRVRAVLASSADGSYVSAVWPAARTYAIFYQGATAWQEIAQGSGLSVAWHASAPQFAVVSDGRLSAPSPASAADKKDKKEKKDKKKDKKKGAEEATPSPPVAPSPPGVQVWEASGTHVQLMHRLPVSVAGDAVRVYSGALLGVALGKAAPSAPALAGSGPTVSAAVASPSSLCTLQLVDWAGGGKVGGELPEPVVLAWEPGGRAVALAYPTQVIICATRPTLTPVACLPVAGAQCMEWALRQLYILTPTHIHLAIMSLPPDTSPPAPTGVSAMGLDMLGGLGGPAPASITTAPGVHVLLLELAGPSVPPPGSGAISGFGSGMGWKGKDLLVADATGYGTLLPSPVPRPPGPLVLLGPRDGSLWLVNAHAQATALPLCNHNGMRALVMAASGDAVGAAALAAAEVAPHHHDALAALLCGLDGVRGAQAALGHLTGLSLAAEVRIRLLLRHWPQAMEGVEALMAGYTSRPTPTQFTFPVTSVAFGGSSLGSARRGGAPLDLAFVGSSGPVAGKAHPDDLDWSQPLRGAATSTAVMAAAAAAAPSEPPAAPAPGGVELGLSLLESLVPTGQLDVCRHLINMLQKASASLTAHEATRLTAAMAETCMRQELPALSSALPAQGAAGPDTGTLAALLSGHVAVVGDALRATPGLRDAQVAASSQGAAAARAEWAHSLATSAQALAGPGTWAEGLPRFIPAGKA